MPDSQATTLTERSRAEVVGAGTGRRLIGAVNTNVGAWRW